MNDKSVIVIGAGIAGLTASSLLAEEGISVTLLEAHSQIGGCAGTFRRGEYLFDVGATQVAGFEKGGVHQRLFNHLNLPLPKAERLDPACLVDLRDGFAPINVWRDPKKWTLERKKHFPGTDAFWNLCTELHKSSWAFASRDPVLPPSSLWDFMELFKAIRPINLSTAFLSSLSVEDLLRITSADQDLRLKKFLDLQLKLYSQESVSETSALYGATVLNIAQEPHGLWHLQGSMQALSDTLKFSIERNNVKLLLKTKAIGISANRTDRNIEVKITDAKGEQRKLRSKDVICTLPPQNLLSLISANSALKTNYLKRIESLRKPSGAIVFYGAINRCDLQLINSSHIQIADTDLGSIFISISQDGDGRAPKGQATVIASIFTETSFWLSLGRDDYLKQKELTLQKIINILYESLSIKSWRHKELATPVSFLKWTGRKDGIVGGLGQRPSNFGILSFPSRTPINGLWLCGDSIHPGEGTAGVSYSAFMVVRQLMAKRGRRLNLK